MVLNNLLQRRFDVANDFKANPLHQHMAHLVALEADLGKSLEPLLDHVQPEIAALARDLHAVATEQLQAVEARLNEIAGNDVTDSEFEDPLQSAQLSILSALIGYAKMQVLARRFGHAFVTNEGKTDKISMRHTANYIKALHSINQLLHDNVVKALDAAGLSCQCPCPSCSLGVCLCAVSSRLGQKKAWTDEPGVSEEVGVFVHSPPADSAAAKGGLLHGDIIQTADGQKMDSILKLQEVVKGHASGETIKLQITRGSDELRDIEVARP
jgi:hypothetical protein